MEGVTSVGFRTTYLVAGQKLDWRMQTDFTLSFIHSFIIVQTIIEVLNEYLLTE